MQDDGKRAVKGSGSVDRFVNGPIRYASVGALRGIAVAAMLLVNNPGDWAHVYRPLRHADWHGCTPTDLIFPLFLFVVGVSIALGLMPRLESGADRVRLQRSAYVRAARILGLGLLLHALAFWSLDKAFFRPWGVLQRIGLCFLLAAGAALYMRPRAQWWLIAALLLGYWVLLELGGSYAPLENLASRMDTWLLGPMNYQFDPATGRGHDPEGLLSTLGALATTLLGLRAGDWLRHGRTGALMLAAWLHGRWATCGRSGCRSIKTSGPRRMRSGPPAGRRSRCASLICWSTAAVSPPSGAASASTRLPLMPVPRSWSTRWPDSDGGNPRTVRVSPIG